MALSFRILACLALLSTPASILADDLPPAGYSLFDRLFSKPGETGYRYEVPYPFEALVKQLESRLFASGNIDEPLVAVLIPRGRSLQREAARPDYYRFPRIVMALDRESEQPLLTKNRLFLGYQEKSESLEVISYNESIGRFEYQVVSDYAAGKAPVVRYARRQLCLSCHQNEATIYAKPLWRESNFNNAVADRIARHQSAYHGIIANAHKGNSGRFDQATDQASMMQTYQRVWREGCEVAQVERENRACRAGLFLAAVQEALASMPRPKYRSALIENKLIAPLQANWERRWPDGMPIASADINDRDAPMNDDIDVLPPDIDPMTLRPPLAHWTYRAALARSVQGIGDQFLLGQDLVRLNYVLVHRAELTRAQRVALAGRCELELPRGLAIGEWINLDCRFNNDREGNIGVEGEFRYRPDGDGAAESHQFLFTGQAGWARVAVNGGFIANGRHSLRLNIDNAINPKLGRLWDNRRIAEFTLQLPPMNHRNRVAVDARLVLVDDLGRIEQAIQRMLDDANAGRSDLFDRGPIQGLGLMQALLEKLDAAKMVSRLDLTPTGLQQLRPEVDRRPQQVLTELPADSPLQLVYRYCATCHRGNGSMPPGFLWGNLQQVKQQLRQCAPRIAYRLDMWRHDIIKPAKSPMPPASFIRGDDNPDWWRDSRDLRELRAYVGDLLDAQTNLHDIPYEQLPPCRSPKAGLARIN